MENLPAYISATLILTTIVTIFIFSKAAGYSKAFIILMAAWLALQAIISISGFYKVTDSMPPRFGLLIVPPLLLIACLFILKRGRHFIDKLDLKLLTLLHVIRIPIEFVLLWLCLHKVIPQLMTFEGRNFDIFSGVTAPIVFYFGFIKKRLNRKIILAWNYICLGLLINIVVNAILSAPSPFQRFGFDQPNIAIFYFPFVWLPCYIVPLVLFSHLAAIRKLVRPTNGSQQL